MNKYFVGIDPGISGAVALIDPRGGAYLWDTPTLEGDPRRGKKTARRIYDERQMAVLVWQIERRVRDEISPNGVLYASIEQVHAMPKQGVSSSFTFGEGYGIWLGILAAVGISYGRVTPQRWQKDVLADGPKSDQAAVAFAGRLYPDAQLRGPRGALLMGRADALLIAHHGRCYGPFREAEEKSLQAG